MKTDNVRPNNISYLMPITNLYTS